MTCVPHVLREYAFVADGERGALIDPQGCVAWLCVPRWHDDAVFGALVGGSGHCQVVPADPWHVWGGYGVLGPAGPRLVTVTAGAATPPTRPWHR